MSDTKLRELERRWKETGSPDDEAAYLLERVRVGDLTQERLELAAYYGHAAAGRVVGRDDVYSPWSTLASADRSARWLNELESTHGIKCVIGLVCAIGERISVTTSLSQGDKADLTAELERIETWLACPCDDHFRRLLSGAPLRRVHSVVSAIAAVVYPASERTAALCEGESAADLAGQAIGQCLPLLEPDAVTRLREVLLRTADRVLSGSTTRHRGV